MKIIKIASETVPSGFVKIRVTITPDGTMTRKIIRGGQSTCQSGDEKKLLEDLFNTQIPGYFGQFGEVVDSGHTPEFWEQNPVQPAQTETPEQEEESPVGQPPEREPDTGYAV